MVFRVRLEMYGRRAAGARKRPRADPTTISGPTPPTARERIINRMNPYLKGSKTVNRTTTFATAALFGLAALSFAGYSAAAATTTPKVAEARAQTISLVGRGGERLFITPAGQTSPFPTGPLARGTRVLAYETDTQDGVAAGTDFEQCTMSFGLNALCYDTAMLPGRGQLLVSYILHWPSTGTSGPSSWTGQVIGGSGAYDGARGQFQAVASPDGSDRITLTFTTTS
jgi:hypothetical protein